MNNRLKINNEYQANYFSVNKNYGFAEVKLDENKEDITKVYIPMHQSMFSMTGDKVLIKITKEEEKDKSAEGIVLKILERKTLDIVGVFKKNKQFAFVEPINTRISFDIYIDKNNIKKIPNESLVVCKILEGKKSGKNPEGIILDVIGHKDDPNAQILSIVRSYDIRYNFDKNVLKEAEKVANDITENDLIGRKDLRNITTITIDSEDAKDLDDAISIETFDNGDIKLYVSIADVSHYVKEDSLLDIEAKKRGNSVYLIDRVIPMLPHVLSNGMCSLNEDEDRLTLTCEILYDKDINIKNSSVYKSIIHSNKRMSYNGVHAILNELSLNNGEDIKSYEPYKDLLNEMLNLSLKIRQKRVDEGSIEFDFKECKIIVDKNLEPIDIKEYERYESHKMIEDFMVSANEQVSKIYTLKQIPFVYRTHEECDDIKIENLVHFLNGLGISFVYKDDLKPKQIQQLLNKVKNKPYQYVVEKMTLKSMMQAKYTSYLVGHFALALKYYSHFTSPIRRYSDLQIHRIIHEVIENKFDDKRSKHYENILPKVTEHISKTERTAIDCEREVEQLKKCEYMQNFLYHEFIGTVSNITNFGIFVELDNTIEGMIPLRMMDDDYYIFNEDRMELVGERTKYKITIGMKLTIQLVNANPETREIDFMLIKDK